MDLLTAGGGQLGTETQTPCAAANPIRESGAEVQSCRDAHSPNDLGKLSPETEADPQPSNGTQPPLGISKIPLNEGAGLHNIRDPHLIAEVGVIVALWRQRQDLSRAYQRLDLQCQAVIRRYSDGDKAIAAKRWATIRAGADDEVAPILVPYQMAMEPLAEGRHALELQLAKRAKKLPIWAWAEGVRGLGALSLAGLIGEAGRPLTDYHSVSALWKRMGLAVIQGGRQRRVAGDAALEHGYAPQRRAFAYVLSTNLMRSQGADGPYRAIYDVRKAYELARDIPKAHAHNRALRVMVKRLIQDAWIADRSPIGASLPDSLGVSQDAQKPLVNQ